MSNGTNASDIVSFLQSVNCGVFQDKLFSYTVEQWN